MRFQEIEGQDKIKQHLTDTFLSGRTAHAQIFLGTEGCGKLALALAYAQYLLCEQPNKEDSCGQCNACRKVQKLIHPDLHFSYPTIGTGKISTNFAKEWRAAILENPYLNITQWLGKLDATSQKANITKNECVDIVRKFSFKTVEGPYKILILWMPEFLDKEGNRLLKLIEEPQPNTVFILVAENQDKILNTILSRCQLVRIPQLNSEQLENYLVNKQGLAAPKAKTIAHLSEGNINKAVSLIGEVENSSAKLFVEWLRICFQGHGRKMVSWVDGVITGKDLDKKSQTKLGRKDQLLFFQYGLYFLREYVILKATGDETKIRLQPAELQTAQGLTKFLELSQVQQLSALFDECMYYIERNVNPKILMLDASIGLSKILKSNRKGSR